MLKRMNIGNKLALILIAFAVAITTLLSASFYLQFDKALRERVLLQLSSVKQLKIVKIRAELTDYIGLFQDLDINALESEDFFYLGLHDQMPARFNDFNLGTYDPNRTGIQLIDLTTQDASRGIVICFVRQVGEKHLIGMAEIADIQSVLLERTGLGETGESYLVGEDFRLLTKSRFENEDPRNVLVKSQGVTRAFAGQPGEDDFTDYRGIQVFGAYEKIEMNGLKWVLLSEINKQEALSPLQSLRTNLIFIVVFIFLFILVVSYMLSKMIVSPVIIMQKKLMRMSKGVLEKSEKMHDRKDEIGRMFEALDKLIDALTDTIAFAGKIGDGDFEVTYNPLSGEDKLGEALLQMKKQLKDYKENEQRLIKENQQSIVNGEEKERSRFSKELHDGLGPMLTTLRINIQSAALDEATKMGLLNQLDETISEVRRMSNNLMPSVLTDFGAGEAIGNLIAQIQKNAPVIFKYKNDMSSESKIDDSIHIALYRIAQESINNALKHAEATEIRMSLSEFEDHVGLFISDNGKGFQQNATTAGNGLRNMKERVKLTNGTIQIDSGPEGTTIEIEIPIS
jgi:signal transduction histidine kinase